MAASHTKLLNLIATILLAVTAITCIMLGRWQLSRAEQRREIAAVIERGRAAQSINLNHVTQTDTLQAWTPAQVEGVWQPESSLLLDNRNLDGKPGLWLATPLLLADGRALLVLRGWFARPIGSEGSPSIPTPAGLQSLTGEIALRVPRLFELWGARENAEVSLPPSWPNKVADMKTEALTQQTEKLPRLQNIDIDVLSKRLNIQFLPVVLMQKNNSEDGLKRVWPEPSVDADKNTGYAMQWFGFAAIAVIAWLGFAWRIVRRKKTG